MGAIVKISSPVDLPLTALDVETKAPAVLIVDDEPSVRNMVRMSLAEKGYTVLDATGAAEALELSKSLGDQQIDLLIVDHGLTPGNGRALAESILQFCPHSKVLITSGRSYQLVHEEDGFPPGSAFLQKPFTAQQVLATVQNVLFPGMQ
jgi:DNA-binding response OmpR family regulator